MDGTNIPGRSLKHQILLLGAGKIGSLIALRLAASGRYEVHLADRNLSAAKAAAKIKGITPLCLAADNQAKLDKYLSHHRFIALVSALPYHCNPLLAQLARDHQLHYLDLTEDREVTCQIKEISQGAKQAFIPQCGLAPGFISIVTADLIEHFQEIDQVKMRVGALPLHPHNSLKYSLTWSTDGLINEYGNPCQAIRKGELVQLKPLDGYETLEFDGLLYEAFNTSGGLGNLAESQLTKVNNMDYKTLRYPGHAEKIRFLMDDLKLNQHRGELKCILERAIPRTLQDVVLVYVSVIGWRSGELFEENYYKKIYSQELEGETWSAIQVTTASSLCCILDLLFENETQYQGVIPQETFPLSAFLANPFGQIFL